MKVVRYTTDATKALRRHRNVALRLMEKIDRYAETGAGDVKNLVGSSGKRLRVADYRIVFEEDETSITITDIGPRSHIYK